MTLLEKLIQELAIREYDQQIPISKRNRITSFMFHNQIAKNKNKKENPKTKKRKDRKSVV